VCRVVTHHGYDSDAEEDDGAAAGGGSGDEASFTVKTLTPSVCVCALLCRVVTHHGYDSDGEGDDGAAAGGGSGDEATEGAAAGSSGVAGRAEAAGTRSPAQMDPETVFMQVRFSAAWVGTEHIQQLQLQNGVSMLMLGSRGC
jgi:hypothetical protein